MSERRVLLVGGIDSSGRAGLDADREAAAAAECEAVAIASAMTEQDLFEVSSVEERLLWPREAEESRKGGAFAALKFGLLPGVSSIVEAARLVARAMHGAPRVPAVVDPVAISSGGYRFWSERELVAVRDSLLVAGPVLTPNLDELALLAWEDAETLAADPSRRVAAAERLLQAGVSAVVATGGHGPEDQPSQDLVVRPGEEPVWIERVREPGPGIRGSGCRFATALACGLARGEDLVAAARAAGDYVAQRIREGDPENAEGGS
ncbi:MAG: bifunctional hydroxymethylpyrimidine kinase/phosphomethylpyrimidine kinase [Planctomycetota bacterium]|nr:bifunctional hydroxymethylpyrimidine kinase/phosphomethylpyrimidine kinase [Planctomycetota bacterium]